MFQQMAQSLAHPSSHSTLDSVQWRYGLVPRGRDQRGDALPPSDHGLVTIYFKMDLELVSPHPRPAQHWHRWEGCWRAQRTGFYEILLRTSIMWWRLITMVQGAGPVWSVKDSGIFIIVDADIHINKCVWQDCRCPMKTVHWSVLSNRGPGFMWSSIPQHRQPIRRPHVWFSQKLIRKL